MALPDLGALRLPPELDQIRSEVRQFLADEIAAGRFEPHCDAWLSAADPEFSRRLGERGWLGMTLPKKYGGSEAGALARFVVTEELLAAGAPVSAHWVADRQSGPTLLRFGTEEQKQSFLPGIASGEIFFAIGMSEPESGSDLASVRTRATQVEGGWRLNGTKVWTSGAHHAHQMITLARSAPLDTSQRHAGLSQFLVDLSWPGITINPIRLISGAHHFNEVVLDDVFVPDERVLGEIGNGWLQVNSELAWERSGPERFLSTFPLLAAALDRLAASGASEARARVGGLVAKLWTLRQMSVAVASRLNAGQSPDVEAALVKDVGTRFEGLLTDTIRQMTRVEPDAGSDEALARLLAEAVIQMPGFTLRGGTNEILRGVVAKGLGSASPATTPAGGGDESAAIADAVSAACQEATGASGWHALLWQTLTRMGVTALPVPERFGGAGSDLATTAAVLRALGRNGASVPIVETSLLAGWLLATCGAALPSGPVSAALAPNGATLNSDGDGWSLSATLNRVPWAREVQHIAVLVPADGGGHVVLLDRDRGDLDQIEHGRNVAREPRDELVLDRVRLDPAQVFDLPADAAVDARSFRARGALGRTLLIAGAAERVLELTLEYTGQRVQFGRPLSRFQAIQQLIAQQAGEVAAVRVAAEAAAQALDLAQGADGDAASALAAIVAIAAAKSRAGEAVNQITAIGHQLHGAIGFTDEHVLHLFTTRLWSWRDEYGNEDEWAADLGRTALTVGGTRLWPLLTT